MFLAFCLWEIFWRLWKKLTKKLSFFEDSHGRSLTSSLLFWELWIIVSYHWMYLLYRKKLRLSNIGLKWYWWYCQKFTNEATMNCLELPISLLWAFHNYMQLLVLFLFPVSYFGPIQTSMIDHHTRFWDESWLSNLHYARSFKTISFT